MKVDLELAAALRGATGTGQALLAVFEIQKARRKTFSLAVLAERSGVSKSYLSEVMSGKKKLNARYVPALASALKLGLLEGACLEALAKGDDEAVRKAKRVLALLSLAETPPNRDTLMAFDAYAALSLFRSPPTYAQMAQLFEGESAARVYESIDALVRSGSLVKSASGELRYSEKGMVHNVMRNTEDFVGYWQAALDDARARVTTQAERKDVTCFLSYAVSVKRDVYAAALENLKKTIFEFATSVETQEADMLVRLNVQVYPTRESPGPLAD